jgi:hypothetical protein
MHAAATEATAMHAASPSHAAASAVTAATTTATTARQGGTWLGKCHNARQRGCNNTQTGRDANAFHPDLLLLHSVAAEVAAAKR